MNNVNTNRWIQTFTGKKFDPIDPDPALINIRDIAHALSNQCRYAGHTREFYSVAEHSVHVAQELERNNPKSPALWLAGLLHDAAEAYLTDLPRPIKKYVLSFSTFENRLLEVISKKYGFAYPFSPKVHFVDTSIILDEANALFNPEWVAEWELTKTHKPLGKPIWVLNPIEAEFRFLSEFDRITDYLSENGDDGV
ncbi:MAG: phosphohydrolase [bacterium]|nr:phosphohydrolase [bacterium]